MSNYNVQVVRSPLYYIALLLASQKVAVHQPILNRSVYNVRNGTFLEAWFWKGKAQNILHKLQIEEKHWSCVSLQSLCQKKPKSGAQVSNVGVHSQSKTGTDLFMFGGRKKTPNMTPVLS